MSAAATRLRPAKRQSEPVSWRWLLILLNLRQWLSYSTKGGKSREINDGPTVGKIEITMRQRRG